MSTFRKQINTVLLVLALTTLASCSKSADSSVSSTVRPSATTVWEAKDPQAELESIAKASEAVDYSRISKGKCGQFAMVVTSSESNLYKWERNEWKPTTFPTSEFTDAAIRVTTRDYTWDKVNDFLMTYQNGGPEGTEYGSILHLDRCKWRWADFENSEGAKRSVKWLQYDDELETLSAFDLMPAVMGIPEDTRTDIYVRWEGENSFTLVYSEPDVLPINPSSGSGTSRGPTKTGPTLLRVECSLRETGMSSSWSGTYYSWTYYNIWSNGTRTVAKMGQGYNPPFDC